MSDWRDKIKKARLPEAVVPIVLAGDLAGEYEQLKQQLADAQERPATSLAGSGTAALTERIRQLEDEMRESVIEFRLRALPRSKRPGDDRPTFRELKAEHPPRENNGEMLREDMMAGFINAVTFPEPLVRASVVEPQLSDADWDELMPNISDGQFDELVHAAWSLNRGKVDIPFSSGGSATTRTSDAG